MRPVAVTVLCPGLGIVEYGPWANVGYTLDYGWPPCSEYRMGGRLCENSEQIASMTLILALGNSDQFVQLSDRRLSWNGSLIDDESSKAGYLSCPNARLAFGFTGLARLDSFRTRDWLLDALLECGPPDYDARGVLQRLCVRATETFRFHPVLRSSPRQHRRLSIIFSGYLNYGRSPLAALPGF